MKVMGELKRDDKKHSHCPRCWSEDTCARKSNGREYYGCNSCGYEGPRLVITYPAMRYHVREDKEIVHYSVGAVIERDGKFLLFHRRLYPFKYTIAAGHWDLSDSTPEAAVAREIEEETGLCLSPKGPVYVESLEEPCRRGADYHEWRLYHVEAERWDARLGDEADIIGWYSAAEIRQLELTVPAEHFLRRLKVL